MKTYPRRFLVATFTLSLITASLAPAATQKDFFQNSDLNNGNNYNPAGLPSLSFDVLLTTPATALMLNGASLSMSSLNQLNASSYVISNNTPAATNSDIILAPQGGNSIGANGNDAIYLGGANANLTIQGANGGGGTGLLTLQVVGNIDVAQASSTVTLSAALRTSASLVITKTGAGVLNLSNELNAFGGGIALNGGVTNLLAGFNNLTPTRTGLSVNNVNTGAGSAVILNVQTSASFRGVRGTIVAPSSGLNTATINVQGATTTLGLTYNGTGPTSDAYAGVIAASGNVALDTISATYVQTFSGNNTYTGTTTVRGGILRIDGTTSGQGNYTVSSQPAAGIGTLTGSGAIGLALNGTITVGGANPGRLSAGPDSATGTLNVMTSGTGGVIFGAQSVFLVDIGPAGASDLLSIAEGYIDLTASSDTLALNSLAGGFDGGAYTIASFTQNLGGGIFNTITGLPANYVVSYTPTAIMLLPVPEPATWGLGAQALAMLVWWKYRKGFPSV